MLHENGEAKGVVRKGDFGPPLNNLYEFPKEVEAVAVLSSHELVFQTLYEGVESLYQVNSSLSQEEFLDKPNNKEDHSQRLTIVWSLMGTKVESVWGYQGFGA
ncbi:hypothetical protein HPP92_002740 [Vanilla planifolia]|uniref:Uncharacterized protein n=1 Tax=Vanilla planifolia TaxID=51239 RepID=A0A835RTX4_VANPL|nr:hypothetical protein HPP92_002740 [Vanilla planifolia]